MMVYHEKSISECPGCGCTCVVGIMSLCVTCKIDGYYYVDLDDEVRGWYTSKDAYARGDAPVRGWK